MKKIIYIGLISLIGFISCKAQTIVNMNTYNQGNNAGKYFKDLDHHLDPFIGTWEYQDGNQIFRVTLFKVEKIEYENGNYNPSYYMDEIQGHFSMIEIGSSGQPIETTIYTSQRKMGASNTDWFPVITIGSTRDGINLNAMIYDNSIPYNINYPFVRGNLSLEIISGTNPIQMQWKVTLPQGMYGTDQPTNFNVPTDIILIKKF